MLRFERLSLGGIITNYYCSSKCRHCAYSSSPEWPREYMTPDVADEIFQKLGELGCYVVHIGGGEPLLCPEKLFPILDSAKRNGIHIEYVETNASWHEDFESSCELLKKLQEYGVYTLLISIDPFHNEFIPFERTRGLIDACHRCGMEFYPWLMEFWKDLDSLDTSKVHTLEEFTEMFGSRYKTLLMRRYHLNLRGRALHLFKEYLKARSLEDILAESAPCRELSGVQHFHIDLYKNFIPQSCVGLSMRLEDLSEGADPEKYPLLDSLYLKGIRGLYDIAVNEYGFRAEDKYTGKCDLCMDIRRYLVMEVGLDTPDLQPVGHYKYM